MIKSAKEVRNEMLQSEDYKRNVGEAVRYVMLNIERAKSDGRTHACFNVNRMYENEIKQMFMAEGYTFKPTGYCGGVWQLSEDICW
jgi:hypothetical protein